MVLRFVVCVIDENNRIHFRGRAKIEVDLNIGEKELKKRWDELIEAGKKFILKHLKKSDLSILYVGESREVEDGIIFEYIVEGKAYKVLYKRTGPFGYFLAKFFPFFA